MRAMLKQLTAVVLLAFMAVTAMGSELADKLKLPNHALLMRHALALGIGDPAGYSLNDCSTQRNLDGQGKQQATRTGQWLQRQGIQNAMVLTSPWCRCKDTANLLGYGQPEVEPAIGSFFEASQEAADYTQRLQKRLAQLGPTKGDKALILVTHHVNILDYMGSHVGSGDMVLVQFDAQGKLVSAKRYPSPL
jgi:phosphohistidine phosphatase SixA